MVQSVSFDKNQPLGYKSTQSWRNIHLLKEFGRMTSKGPKKTDKSGPCAVWQIWALKLIYPHHWDLLEDLQPQSPTMRSRLGAQVCSGGSRNIWIPLLEIVCASDPLFSFYSHGLLILSDASEYEVHPKPPRLLKRFC